MQKRISFKNSKGQRLVGVLHMPKGKGPFPTVIVQHGFRVSHETDFIKSIAKALEKAGFVVLRFSLSGHKPSGGTYKEVLVSQFVKDIDRAIKFLLKLSKVNKHRIGIVGHSMGAFSSLIAAQKFNKYIKAVISISSFYNPKNLQQTYYRDKLIVDSNKDYWSIGTIKITKKHFQDRAYLQKNYQIKNIHCPALIIHGNKDKRVQPKDAQIIYNLLEQPKDLKIIKGADHYFYNQKHVKQVVSATLKWFKEYLVNAV